MDKNKDDLGDDLYQACIHNNRGTVEKLVNERKAEFGNSENLMLSVFDAAVIGDATDVVTLCLEKNVPVTAQIMRRILIQKSFASYRAIIEAKAIDINYYIPWYGDILSSAVQNNGLDWAKFCLEHGADPNRNLIDEYQTILAAAAELGNHDMTELLIDYGAKVNGSGAIIFAAEAGHTEIVKSLLAKGADINEVGVEHPQDDRTAEDVGSALTKAIANGHTETALYLVQKGADTNLKDGHGQTARDLAEHTEQTAILQEINKTR